MGLHLNQKNSKIGHGHRAPTMVKYCRGTMLVPDVGIHQMMPGGAEIP